MPPTLATRSSMARTNGGQSRCAGSWVLARLETYTGPEWEPSQYDGWVLSQVVEVRLALQHQSLGFAICPSV